MKHARVPLTLIAVLAAACGGDDADPRMAEPEGGAPQTEQPADDTAFPVMVDSDGTEVEIATQPQRIVSLAPTATETLFAIGAGELVVAADQYSNYPDEAPTTFIGQLYGLLGLQSIADEAGPETVDTRSSARSSSSRPIQT